MHPNRAASLALTFLIIMGCMLLRSEARRIASDFYAREVISGAFFKADAKEAAKAQVEAFAKEAQAEVMLAAVLAAAARGEGSGCAGGLKGDSGRERVGGARTGEAEQDRHGAIAQRMPMLQHCAQSEETLAVCGCVSSILQPIEASAQYVSHSVPHTLAHGSDSGRLSSATPTPPTLRLQHTPLVPLQTESGHVSLGSSDGKGCAPRQPQSQLARSQPHAALLRPRGQSLQPQLPPLGAAAATLSVGCAASSCSAPSLPSSGRCPAADCCSSSAMGAIGGGRASGVEDMQRRASRGGPSFSYAGILSDGITDQAAAGPTHVGHTAATTSMASEKAQPDTINVALSGFMTATARAMRRMASEGINFITLSGSALGGFRLSGPAAASRLN